MHGTMVSAPACSIHAVWRQVKSWDYNGWEVSFAASIFWLLAPISAVFGRSFERWARNTRQSQDRLTVAYLQASARKQKRGFLLRIKLILTRNFVLMRTRTDTRVRRPLRWRPLPAKPYQLRPLSRPISRRP